MKRIVLLTTFVLLAFGSFATIYYSNPSATDATLPASWSTNTTGTGTSPSNFSGSGNIWIAQTSGGLTIGSALNIAGNLKINCPLIITVTPVVSGGITIGPLGSLTISNSGTYTAGCSILDSGTLTVSSGTTLDLGTSYKISGPGSIANSGTIATANTNGTAFPSGASMGGTVNYEATGGGQTVISGSYTNIIFSNSSGVNTLAGSITVSGTFTTTSGGTLSTAYPILGSPTSVSNNGTITTTCPTTLSATPLPAGNTWGGTVQYLCSGASQTLVGGTYNNLIVRGVTASGNISVSNNFTANYGYTADFSSYSLAVSGTTTSTGTLKTSCNSTSSPLPSGVSWGGTVVYYGSGQTVVAGSYTSLTIGNSSGTNTAGGNINVSANLITTAGGTFDMGSYTLGGAMTGCTNNGVISTSSTSTTPIPSLRTFGGTVTFYGSGQKVPASSSGTTYNNLIISGSGTTTTGGPINVNGNLTIGSSTTLNMASYTLALGGSGSVSNSGTIQTGVTGTNGIPTGVTYGGTVEFTSLSGGQYISGSFNNLTLDNTSGTNTAHGNITVSGNFNTTAGGTLDMTGSWVLNVSSATVNNNGTIKVSAISTLSTTPISSGMTWGGTILIGSGSANTTLVGGTYNNLTVAGPVLASGNVVVNGALTVNSSGTMDMGNNVLSGSVSSVSVAGVVRTSVPTSTSSSPLPSGLSWTGGGTVHYYNSTGGQTVVSGTYDNLWLLTSNPANTANVAGGDITINSVLRGNYSGTLDMSTYALKGAFHALFGGTVIKTQNTSSNPIPTGTYMGLGVNYNNASGGQTIVSGSYSYLYNSNTSGTNTLAGDVTVTSNLIINGGSNMNNAGHNISVSGRLYGTGTEFGSGTISLTGIDTNRYTISGATVSNLSIGLITDTITKGQYYLTGNLNITGTLTLGANLDLDSNNLVLSNGATIAGSFSNKAMIVSYGNGFIQQYTNGTGTFTFPIGDSFYNYSPITINLKSGTFSAGSSHIDVNIVQAKDPNNVGTNNYLNRYWNINTTSITSPTYDINSAYYVTGDVTGTESSVSGAIYSGSLPWTYYGSANTGSHYLSATNVTGTSNQFSGLSGVKPTVTPNTTGTSICSGSNTTLSVASSTGDPTLTYSWAPGTGLSATTGTSVTAAPTTSTVYTLTVTDGNGNTGAATISVTVNALPTVSYTTAPGANVCANNNVVYATQTGESSYTWNFSGSSGTDYNVISGGSSADNSVTIQWLTTGSQTVGVNYVDNNGCTATSNTSSSTNVNALPAVSFASAPGANICASSSQTYSTQSGMSGYSWTIPGSSGIDYNITGGSTATNSVTLQWLTSGSKTVTINYANSNSCTALSATANTTNVNTLPVVTYSVVPSSSICVASTGTYTTQSGMSGYSWTIPGTSGTDYNITAGSTSSNTIDIQWLTSGTKTVSVNYSDGNGCTALSPASNNTTVNALPVVSFTAAPGANVCASSAQTYTTQSGMSGYTWTIPGSLGTDYTITGGSTASNTVTLKWLTSGSQTVSVNYSNSNGCSALSSTSNTTNVNSLPVVSFVSAPGANVCASSAQTYSTQSGMSGYSWTIPGSSGIDYNITGGSTATNSVTLQWLTSGSKTVTINYTNSNSCTALSATSNTTNVNTLPVVTYSVVPSSSICLASTGTYTTQGGMSGYSWTIPGTSGTDYNITAGSTSSNTIDIQWLTSGTKTVSVNYSDGNGCTALSSASNNTTVNALPVVSFTAAPGANVCASSSQTYTTQSGMSGYTWTIPGSSGTDYTITGGSTATNTVTLKWLTTGSKTVTINYANSNGCTALSATSNTTNVNALPTVSFTTAPSAASCASNAVTYATQTGQSNYVWSVPGVSGTDYSITSGGIGTSNSTVTLKWLTSGAKNVTVNYTNSNSCTALAATTAATTVNALPTVSFTSSPTATSCVATSYVYTTQSGQSSYVWSVPGVLSTDYTIVSGGTGSSSNTVTISWITTGSKTVSVNYSNASGCSALTSTTSVTSVNPNPATIGNLSGGVCTSLTTTATESTSGGTWSSSNTAYATINSSGVITGVSTAGANNRTVNISYTLGTGCYATGTFSVRQNPSIITGISSSICPGSGVALSDSITGGAWACTPTSIATVNAAGVLTGVSNGTAVVSYTQNSCTVTKSVTVSSGAAISPITGTLSMCTLANSSLSDATAGGTWSSSATSIATVDPTYGVVTGVSPGNASIVYTSSGCSTSATVTVNIPAAITGGSTMICYSSNTNLNNTITYSDATGGGTWYSSATSVATINGSGIVTPVASSGTFNVSYARSGCTVNAATVTVTTNPLAQITAPQAGMCVGATLTMTETVTGGVWTSSSTSLATVSPITSTTAGVTGVSYGGLSTPAYITYTLGSCYAYKSAYSLTFAPVSGSSSVCNGSTTTYTDATTAGNWYCRNVTGTASIVSGVLTASVTGTVLISYGSAGCYSTDPVTINPNPAAITGTMAFCASSSSSLSDATVGGNWTTSNSGLATVNSSGVVSGVASGNPVISYTLSSTGCYSIATLTLNPCREGNVANNGGNTSLDSQPQILTVYPNPTSGLLNFEQSTVDNTEYGVRVMNYAGEVVYEDKLRFSGGTGQADLRKLSGGFYIVELQIRPGERQIFKLVIER